MLMKIRRVLLAVGSMLAASLPIHAQVTWWPAEGNAEDVIGAADGQFVGDANALATGVTGSAFAFDGTGDQVTIPSPPMATSNFTVEGWVFIDSPWSGYRTIYGDSFRGLWLLDRVLNWWDAGGNVFQGTASMSVGVWHHIAIVYAGNATLTGYVDGHPDGCVPLVGAELPAVGGADDVGIGGHQAVPEFFSGLIDELRVHDQALSASDIAGIYGSAWSSYCTSAANSSGMPSVISALGSASVAANDLALRAGPMASGEPGIYYYGPSQIQAPFGNGFRCVGGSTGLVVRIFPFVAADASGFMSTSLDNTGPAHGQVAPGASLNFQAWFRDPAGGGAGFNLSDGLWVTFVP